MLYGRHPSGGARRASSVLLTIGMVLLSTCFLVFFPAESDSQAKPAKAPSATAAKASAASGVPSAAPVARS